MEKKAVPAKSNKPGNTAFKQQRLKAWQPVFTPKVVLPAFFLVGCLFIPLGVGLYLQSANVSQYVVDYTNCASGRSFSYPITNWTYSNITHNCTINFNIDSDMIGPVYLYIRLTNFYQNHRRYVKSFDASQLANSLGLGYPNSNCDPLSTPQRWNKADFQAAFPWAPAYESLPSNAQFYPCGLIANSFFSDVISDLFPLTLTGGPSTLPSIQFSDNGIAWPTDSSKFVKSNLPSLIPADQNLTTTIFPPPQWAKAFPGADFSKGYTAANFPDISTNQRFQVWMRPAGLPAFRKLWGQRSDKVPQGSYRITITQNFDVSSFGGTKSLVISTASVLGGKNPFLGVSYIFIGILCWLIGIVFLIRQMIKPRKLGDYTYLSWNQPQRVVASPAPSMH